jgi:hypothetical protein
MAPRGWSRTSLARCRVRADRRRAFGRIARRAAVKSACQHVTKHPVAATTAGIVAGQIGIAGALLAAARMFVDT